MANSVLDNKRILKNTSLLYIRSIILLFLALYTSRVTLKVLGVSDYGIYQLVGGVVGMFSMLSSTLTAASQRFITYSLGEGDLNKTKAVFSTCVTLHIILGVIIVVILEAVGIWFLYNKLNIPTDRITIAGYVMHCSIATFFINIISVPYNSAIIAHEKMGAFAYISLLEGLLKLIAVLVLPLFSFDNLLLYSIFYLIIAIVIRLTYSIYCTKTFEETNRTHLKVDKVLFRDMFSFAGWNLVGSSALVLRNQGVDILLNVFFGVSINAAKGLSNQVQSAAQQLVGNFTTSVNPQLTKSIAKGDYQRAHSLIVHGGKMAFFLTSLIAVPFVINGSSLMALWLVNVPKYATELSILAFIFLLTDTLSRFLINSILAYGKIKYFQIILGGIKMLSIPFTWGFLKLGGSPLTGMLVNIGLQMFCLFGELYFAKRYIALDVKRYFVQVVLRCWGVFLLALVLSFIFHKFISSNILLSLPVSFILICLFIFVLGIDKSERNLLMSVLKIK